MTAKEEKKAASKVAVVARPVAVAPKAEDEEELAKKPIQDKALGFFGGLITIIGVVLPWVIGTASGSATEETFTGLQTGAPGVIVLVFGLIPIGLLFLNRRSSVIGAMIFDIAALVAVIISIVNISAVTNISNTKLQYGVPVSLVGTILTLIGAILVFRRTPQITVNLRALITFIFAMVGTFLFLLYPFIFPGSGAVGALDFIFGLLLLIPTFYMIEGEGWSWSSAVIVLILALLIAVPTLSFVVIGYSIAFAFVLYLFRLTYGVGAWKIQKEKENKEAKIRNAKRTANPEGLHCPRCKSTKLYICDDGSTFCANCKEGFVNIHDVKAAPKSSVQI